MIFILNKLNYKGKNYFTSTIHHKFIDHNYTRARKKITIKPNLEHFNVSNLM